MIRLIKRYGSRKLYDTEESRYVSLEELAAWFSEDDGGPHGCDLNLLGQNWLMASFDAFYCIFRQKLILDLACRGCL